MEEPVAATKLELWCEGWWRDLGYKPKILRRELAFTDYKIGSEVFQVPLVPVQGTEQFRADFLARWRDGDHDS